MAERLKPPHWPTCQLDASRGQQQNGATQCLAHASKDDRAAAL
jgi:hypothetical protein